jgi:hypothetical protein
VSQIAPLQEVKLTEIGQALIKIDLRKWSNVASKKFEKQNFL